VRCRKGGRGGPRLAAPASTRCPPPQQLPPARSSSRRTASRPSQRSSLWDPTALGQRCPMRSSSQSGAKSRQVRWMPGAPASTSGDVAGGRAEALTIHYPCILRGQANARDGVRERDQHDAMHPSPPVCILPPPRARTPVLPQVGQAVDSWGQDIWWKGVVVTILPAGAQVYMPGASRCAGPCAQHLPSPVPCRAAAPSGASPGGLSAPRLLLPTSSWAPAAWAHQQPHPAARRRCPLPPPAQRWTRPSTLLGA
jgi:hypothetical protein